MYEVGLYVKVNIFGSSEVQLIIAKTPDKYFTYISNSKVFPDASYGTLCTEKHIEEFNVPRKYLNKRIFRIRQRSMTVSSKRNCPDCKLLVRC